MRIFDRVEAGRLRSVLIIMNYELTGLLFDQPRVQKCCLSAISLQDRCERLWRRDLWEHDRAVSSPAWRSLSRGFAFETVSRAWRELARGYRLVHPGISSPLSYSERCLQLSSHDMPYYRPGSVCRLSRSLLHRKITTDT